MENLTQEQKADIAIEMIEKEPLQTVGQIALLKISKLAIESNSDEITLSIKATFNGKRYKCKMSVTYEEIDFAKPK